MNVGWMSWMGSTSEEGAWKLIDLDASAIIDQEEAGAKFSSAYSPPELAQRIFIADQQPASPLTAQASFDVWGFGVVLFEMLSQADLFVRNRSDDNVNKAAAERELCMWRSMDNERLRAS